MVSAGLVEYEKDEESQALLLVVISTQGNAPPHEWGVMGKVADPLAL